jgi:hypothetical protein
MPEVRVSFLLPSFLRIASGEYEAGPHQARIEVLDPLLLEDTVPRTRVRAQFSHDDTDDQNVIQRQKARDADQLLWGANRLLRWYRAVTHRAEVVEVTRAQASPFEFEMLGGAVDPGWGSPLRYEAAGPEPLDMPNAEITQRVRNGFGSGQEPDVSQLFLLDADRALTQGRFREAVLFCWSTIDSVFSQKYDSLVAVALAGEWSKAREFFTGVDFGMKNKMTAALFLVCQQSLYQQPGNFWERLSTSYTKRNHIIHRGETASEDEARQAIAVAEQVIQIMNAIPVPAAVAPAVNPGEVPPPPPPPPPAQEAAQSPEAALAVADDPVPASEAEAKPAPTKPSRKKGK